MGARASGSDAAPFLAGRDLEECFDAALEGVQHPSRGNQANVRVAIPHRRDAAVAFGQEMEFDGRGCGAGRGAVGLQANAVAPGRGSGVEEARHGRVAAIGGDQGPRREALARGLDLPKARAVSGQPLQRGIVPHLRPATPRALEQESIEAPAGNGDLAGAIISMQGKGKTPAICRDEGDFAQRRVRQGEDFAGQPKFFQDGPAARVQAIPADLVARKAAFFQDEHPQARPGRRAQRKWRRLGRRR